MLTALTVIIVHELAAFMIVSAMQGLMMQMDRAERGFSFTRDGPLDMRMGLSGNASAEQILNSWPEAELARVFRDYGEERHWRAYAARVVNAREQGAIRTTQQLCSALGHIGKTKGKRNKIHPATRIFQVIFLTFVSMKDSLLRLLQDSDTQLMASYNSHPELFSSTIQGCRAVSKLGISCSCRLSELLSMTSLVISVEQFQSA